MKENILSYTTRIGKTTFIVNVKQSESAKKPLNTVFQEICRHEMLGDFSEDIFEFRKLTKIILTNSFPRVQTTEPRHALPSFLICQS